MQRSPAIRKVITGSYLWMAIGLLISGIVAYFVAQSPALMLLLNGNLIVFFCLFGAQLALVYGLSRNIQQLSAGTATNMFLLYALLSGASMSSLFYAYDPSSIAAAFWITAITFFVMSVYGTSTKTDLTTAGNISLMVLVCIIIASLVALFFDLPMLNLIISIITIIVFAILIARDAQQIGALANYGQFLDKDTQKKGEVMGALGLYLDVINVFYALLNLTSSRDRT